MLGVHDAFLLLMGVIFSATSNSSRSWGLRIEPLSAIRCAYLQLGVLGLWTTAKITHASFFAFSNSIGMALQPL